MLQDKQSLRREQKQKLLNIKDKTLKDNIILDTLVNREEFKKATTLLLYYPLKDEVDITPLFDLDKTIALPVCKSDGTMEFHLLTEDLHKGICFNKEPVNSLILDYDSALIIVPNMAMTLDGMRLGRGKGYYDRYLSSNKTRLFSVGLGYEESIVESVFEEKHDESLDLIIVNNLCIQPKKVLA